MQTSNQSNKQTKKYAQASKQTNIKQTNTQTQASMQTNKHQTNKPQTNKQHTKKKHKQISKYKQTTQRKTGNFLVADHAQIFLTLNTFKSQIQ